ncbi:DUF1206 domain-containing protein [Billgrantia diversa]|uniref:DUF1206 domain-containing protein n=1 Tax=Halomonas sp. MCCC 1A13316 TaxID=2733487 RepID=UPI0018A617B9|nr:DUF1206 domain-containing protein [Halomonas sp. MCCC 1A13316]QOR38499.1 DUF1206 domain-containing protein [Halomonas sp. MCCC 1A13316]
MVNSIPAPDHGDAFDFMARWGYAARGIVYLLVGGLAMLAAIGQGGEATDSRGALESLMGAAWGDVLLIAISLGLLGYALWRCIQAIKDTDHHGTDAKGLAIRTGLLVSAVTHTLLAFFAASLIFTLGANSSGSDGGSEGLASWLMQQPYGRWLVGVVGIAIIGAGCAHGIKGWKAKFDRHFNMPPSTQRWAYPICRFGLVTRGLVFLLIGAFFIIAAYQFDPDQAGGLAEVFSTLRSQVFGRWLLAFVALGLFAFGLYSLLEAIYRRVNP